MRFTLKQIEYFVAAAETGSITLAAQRIPISQPSVSTAVAGLEEQFGIQLFIRHHAQGLSLTTAGHRFLKEARTLLRQAEELEAAAGEISSRVSGPLAIGCLSTLYPLMVPELLQCFRAEHGAVTVEAVAGNQIELFEGLRNGRLSLVLTYNLDIPADLDFTPLAELPPFAFVSADHRFADRTSVSLGELGGEGFILLDLPLSREYFLGLFEKAGLTPRIIGRFAHIDVVRSLVARGEGFGLANAQPKNRASLDGLPLAYLALDDAPQPLIHGIVTLKGSRRTPAMQAFLGLCHDKLHNKKLPGTV
ncbi:LysR family transcriptional regulator [Acidisoma sp. S159]|uniref:LysR family transcriptional regulator n=1 Tax=Acidisoma sp. S159 TaxID=1747225 RepID=UPI00131AAD90|nr:LysR family transcriptional regulator [Acidisoma sp. S159]